MADNDIFLNILSLSQFWGRSGAREMKRKTDNVNVKGTGVVMRGAVKGRVKRCGGDCLLGMMRESTID